MLKAPHMHCSLTFIEAGLTYYTTLPIQSLQVHVVHLMDVPEDRWKGVCRVTGAGTTFDWQSGRRQEATPAPFSSVSPTSPAVFCFLVASIPITDTNYHDLLRAWLTGPGKRVFKGRGCCSPSGKVPSRRKRRSTLAAGRTRSFFFFFFNL